MIWAASSGVARSGTASVAVPAGPRCQPPRSAGTAQPSRMIRAAGDGDPLDELSRREPGRQRYRHPTGPEHATERGRVPEPLPLVEEQRHPLADP